MPTTLGPVQIANLALSRIGSQAINSLADTNNPASVACNNNYQLAYLAVSRAAKWNCLATTAVLAQIPQTPLPNLPSGGLPPIPPTVPTWEPNTTFAANSYFTFGGYFYFVLINYTSSNNFTVDLTNGSFVQTNLPTSYPFAPFNGSAFPSGWAYQYELPADFQLLMVLNGNTYWGFQGFGSSSSDFQIMGKFLFCNTPQAVIQYIKNEPDSTQFDALFTEALSLKLGSMIATALRQDGGRMELELEGGYKSVIKQARTMNGNEQQVRRFNPIGSSMFNRSRYGGINGRVYLPNVPNFIAKIVRWLKMVG